MPVIHSRIVILTMLGAGSAALGLLLGLTTSTAISPSSASQWRHLPVAATSSQPASVWIDANPPELSANWDPESRVPTWKRARAAREMTAFLPEMPYHAGRTKDLDSSNAAPEDAEMSAPQDNGDDARPDDASPMPGDPTSAP